MTAKKSIDDLPDNARDIRGVFSGVTETGVHFEVYSTMVSRPMRSNELVKTVIKSQVRGRPVGSMHVDEARLYLLVQNRHRIEIEQTPSNMYRYGRRIEKSLKHLIVQVMGDMGVEIQTPSIRRP